MQVTSSYNAVKRHSGAFSGIIEVVSIINICDNQSEIISFREFLQIWGKDGNRPPR